MGKLNRGLHLDDLENKGFPFACENCGNKPTPEQVIELNGVCEVCNDNIIAYTIDTARLLMAHAISSSGKE